MKRKLFTLFLVGFAFVSTASAETNEWANGNIGTFKWETGSNWSLGVPPSKAVVTLIDKAIKSSDHEASRTVTIDATTVLSNAINGCMALNTFTLVAVPSDLRSELFLNNTGTAALTVEFSLSISNGAIFSITNSAVEMGIPVGTLSVDGTLVLNGGLLTTVGEDNSVTAIVGNTGVGQVTVLDGMWRTSTLYVGNAAGSQGTLLLAGGTTELNGPMSIGFQPGAVGTVWLTGGELTSIISSFNQYDVFVGAGGVGQMTVSNGTWQTHSVFISTNGGSGILTVAGGTSTVYSNLLIGSSDCAGTGAVMVDGGSLFVTNAAHNAVLDVESGTVTLSGGTLVADIFVKTRRCGFFQQTGGTLVVGGVTNIVTPLPLSITSVTSDGQNVFIAWQSRGGVTNFVQATNGNPDGSYNTNFVDISSPIPSAMNSTSQYNDVGGATNIPSRFYRIRQAQ